MDFVTHAAVGALCGRALSGEAGVGVQRRAARLGAVAALLPDADHVLELVSAEAYLVHHRSATHSFLAVALAVIAAAAWPGAERRRRAAIVAAALASHLALDMLTPFGTAVLWPFSPAFPALDGLPVFCPWLLVPALALATWARRRGQAGEPSRHAATVGLAVTLGLCGLGWVDARLGADAVAPPPGGIELAVPDWRYPLSADVLTADGREVHRYRVSLLSGEPEHVSSMPRVEGAADLAAITTAVEAAGPPLARFRIPTAALGPEGQVVFRDAQLGLLPVHDDPFRITVDAAGQREVVEHRRGGQVLIWLGVFVAVLWLGRTPARAKPTAPAE